MSSSADTLNLVVYLPAVVALILAFLPKEQTGLFKWGALGGAILTMLASFSLIKEFTITDNATYQFITDMPWIANLGIKYKTGADGISFVLILLTTVLSSIAILSSFEAITEKVKEYYICLLLLETGMLGVFVSLDLVLFYVFWEAMLIPMYFLIGVWGGANRKYATIKFVLYTLVGSLLMLVAIVWLYIASGRGGQPGTFDLTVLTGENSPLANSSALGPMARMLLFLAFALAFAIKVPMFPFHTWLPDAHVEAPTAGSVILAGVLLKMGTYGFIRYCIPLFPDVALDLAPYFLALSVIGIVYGALVAFVQTDIKKLVAYSSVSHLGFCMLGLFAFTKEGVAGSVLQMINHGLSTGALFLIVGMIYERRHTRDISQFGGIWKVVPVMTCYFLIATLSSVGLPGLNGFVGEFLVLAGAWGGPQGPHTAQWASIGGATGVVLGAVYMLWMFQRVTQGPLENPKNKTLSDLSKREIVVLLPLVVLMFWIGIRPNETLKYFDLAINKQVVQPIESASGIRDSKRQSAPTRVRPGMAPGQGMPSGLPSGLPVPGGEGKAAPPPSVPDAGHPAGAPAGETKSVAPAKAPEAAHPTPAAPAAGEHK